MIKLVYVIVGVSKSEYLNMLRISLASARRYMPAIEIEIVTDEETGKALSVGDIPQKYNARIVAVPIEGEYTTVERSRVLKTNLRELVSGDFLYLDTDTIICEDFSDYVPQGSVNLVADAHCLLAEQEEQGEPIRRAARQRVERQRHRRPDAPRVPRHAAGRRGGHGAASPGTGARDGGLYAGRADAPPAGQPV